MDIGGVVGLDGLVGASLGDGSGNGGGEFGSGCLKHGRSGGLEEHEWRTLKVARNEALLSAPNRGCSSLLRSNSHPLFPDGGQMLSFSSSIADAHLFHPSDLALSCYHNTSYSPSYMRNAGLFSGSPNAGMHGVLTRDRGPFTPSQWMELEHQALIYRYIDANMPIPSSLLMSIRRSFNPPGVSAFSAGYYRSNTCKGSHPVGWGPFYLGYSGNTDPEPGRCRRTDGKKWRCSRDSVTEQKYCERHMNRGRHRSRKHVENENGHAAKTMPIVATSQSASAVSGSRSSNCPTTEQQQLKILQPDITDSSPAQYNRMLVTEKNANERVWGSQGLSVLTDVNSKSMNSVVPIYKQLNAYEGSSSRTNFGFISTNSLQNPHSENICFNRQTESNPLRHFIDDRPRDQSNNSAITWPEASQSDRIQLSISIPMVSSDFSSSSSSPNQEKLTLSPLRLSKELDPIHMGLGVGGVLNEVNQRRASWVPISWETSLGGPLGEVLANTNSTDHSKNCSLSSLNLSVDGWDSSPRIRSSPTGVLQTTFGSLSSSTGSSPRVENYKVHDSTSSLREDLLGSSLVNPSTIPLM